MDALKQFYDDIIIESTEQVDKFNKQISKQKLIEIIGNKSKKLCKLKAPYKWDNYDTQLISKVDLGKVDTEHIEMIKGIIRYYKNNHTISDKSRLVLLRQLVVQNKIHNNLNFNTSTIDEFIEILINTKVLYKQNR
jgi:hypothetical protein